MKVSVIIPSRDARETIGRAVSSCLRQTLRPAEVLVVDDGSTDGTAELAEEAGARCVRLVHGGVARARNAGAAESRGEALVFLDADDELLPHALETLAGRLAASGAGVAYGMVVERRAPPALPRLNGFGFAAGSPPLPAQRNFWRCAIATPGSAAIRADLHRRVGGFVSGYEPMEDRDYFIKCGLLAPFEFCDLPVLDKGWQPGSHGSQHAKRIYRGQRAQRELRGWCLERGIDAGWMPTDREILRRALDEAVWRRQGGILRALRREAAGLGLRHWRSALYATVARGEEPGWICEEPRILDR